MVCDLLADQLNRSFDENEFPEVLKLAKVLPFHKSDDRNDTGNIRPISLLPIISKVLEKSYSKELMIFSMSTRCYRPANLGWEANIVPLMR